MGGGVRHACVSRRSSNPHADTEPVATSRYTRTSSCPVRVPELDRSKRVVDYEKCLRMLQRPSWIPAES